jgi:hypothetical protein
MFQMDRLTNPKERFTAAKRQHENFTLIPLPNRIVLRNHRLIEIEMAIYGYLRVSTLTQFKGSESLKTQRLQMTSYAVASGLKPPNRRN